MEHKSIFTLIIFAALFLNMERGFAQHSKNGYMDVGVAQVDITPDGPIRLAGFGARVKTESEGVAGKLNAKALAFGNDKQDPSILITVDLIGIPGHITKALAKSLSDKVGLNPNNLVISASHTHSGPEVGNLLNILQYRGDHFADSLLKLEHMVNISRYIDGLLPKLEKVALEALKNRKPSKVAWGQGEVGFAYNRRTAGGPVDHSMPLMSVTDSDGKLSAVFVNYACHGVILGAAMNHIHGDWIGEAQRIIEENHPGTIALVAIGCGADSNPSKQGIENLSNIEQASFRGKEIADEAKRLLNTKLQPINSIPRGNVKQIELPFSSVPTVSELIKQTEDKTVKGYYARLALDRIARGEKIPENVSYPIQTWIFGKDLAMVFLPGEVVVDYSLRLKNELNADKLWINAYSNDVPSYIASKRVIKEGGYEAESSMYYYDKPSPYSDKIEDMIINSVHELIPKSFKR